MTAPAGAIAPIRTEAEDLTASNYNRPTGGANALHRLSFHTSVKGDGIMKKLTLAIPGAFLLLGMLLVPSTT